MKSKTPVVIALVLIGAVIAFLISNNFSPTEPETTFSKKEGVKGVSGIDYDTFTIVMNGVMGEGNWSAKGHKVGGDNTLTVTGIDFTLQHSPEAVAPEKAKEDTGKKTAAKKDNAPKSKPKDSPAAPYGIPPMSIVGNIATVEIKKGMGKADLEAAFASPNWAGKKDIHLTEGLYLKGLSIKYVSDTSEELAQLSVDDVSFDGLNLVAADAKTPSGPAGFLKAFQLDYLSYKNLDLSSKELGFNYKVDTMEIGDLKFNGEPLAGLNTVDPTGLASVLSSFTVKNTSTKNVNITLKTTTKRQSGEILISAASLEDQNVQLGQVEALKILGPKLEIRNLDVDDNENILPITLSLKQVDLNGFDTKSYMNKLVPTIISFSKSLNSNNLTEMLEGIDTSMTMSDALFGSYSLKGMAVKGLEFKLGDQITIVMDEASSTLPREAGKIPAATLDTVKGLVITLNDDKSKAVGEFGTGLYKFGQDFGQTRFEINSESVTKHDPKTGIFSLKGTKLTVKNLFELHYDMTISGLTTKRLKELSETPLSVGIIMIALLPDSVFGDIALDEASVNFVDQGLVERVLKVVQANLEEKALSSLSPKDFRKIMLAGIIGAINNSGELYLGNKDVLIKALTAFSEQPKTLELNLKPNPPINTEYLSGIILDEDINALLNALNVTIKVNGEDAPALKFNIPRNLQ